MLDPAAIGSVSGLHELAIGPTPYFIPGEAWLLYVRAPIVAISAFLLFLSPGLIGALALPGSDRFERWLLNGFGVSLVSISLSAAFTQELLEVPLRGGAFVSLVLALLATALAGVEIRLRQGRFVASPLSDPTAKRTLLGLAAAAWLLLAALAPKIYWEAFNGDGAHSFEAMRLLFVRPLPFWESTAVATAQFPGLTTMLFTFPGSWFVRLFGEFEAAARLPFLLYLLVLYAAVVAVAEQGRERLRAVDRALFVLPMIAYGLVMAFSATYDPYSADIALPATTDTLVLITFLGAVLAFLRSEWILLCGWTALAFLAQPNAMLLLVLWGGSGSDDPAPASFAPSSGHCGYVDRLCGPFRNSLLVDRRSGGARPRRRACGRESVLENQRLSTRGMALVAPIAAARVFAALAVSDYSLRPCAGRGAVRLETPRSGRPGTGSRSACLFCVVLSPSPNKSALLRPGNGHSACGVGPRSMAR